MSGRSFDKEELRIAFMKLGARAHAAGKLVGISVDGGSALMLTYAWRVSTRDVEIFDRASVFGARQHRE